MGEITICKITGLNSKGTGRKKNQESPKIRTKAVYLTDPKEQQLLKKHNKKTLNELLRDGTLTTYKSVPLCKPQ